MLSILKGPILDQRYTFLINNLISKLNIEKDKKKVMCTLQINHWIAVGTIPMTKLNGTIQYGPLNPYNSFARDHVTAALFSVWGTCPLHTFVPVGVNKISRCASTTEIITTKVKILSIVIFFVSLSQLP